MATFAILVSLWSLVLSQESTSCGTDQCGLKGCSKDENSMVQVNVGQPPSVPPGTELADQGQSCQEKCGGVNGVLPDACDVDKMLAITTSELVLLAGLGGCQLTSVAFDLPASNAAPYIREVQGGLSKICYYQPGKGGTQGPKQLPTCSATVPPQYSPLNKRVCVCKASTNQDSGGGSAENVGDPHIHSFRGAHYTLLQQGVFVAWNFSKAEPGAAPAEWQLLAAYGGDRFTTQGLLLLDHAGSMEMTADDCTWRIKEEKSIWRQANLGQISAEVGTTSLEVKKLHEKLGETKILKSSILLQMRSLSSGMKNVAKLFTHCVPQKHLDFKITMFDRKDVEYVGGELGVAPDANNNYHFFTKKSMVQMRADQEFKAPGSWVTLGGSPAGAAYLEKQHTALSVLQSHSCTDAEEEAARAACSKHIDEESHAETFSDCLFDLCHGGDESFAQSAAAFLMLDSA